jgi:hypothetical protein
MVGNLLTTIPTGFFNLFNNKQLLFKFYTLYLNNYICYLKNKAIF